VLVQEPFQGSVETVTLTSGTADLTESYFILQQALVEELTNDALFPPFQQAELAETFSLRTFASLNNWLRCRNNSWQWKAAEKQQVVAPAKTKINIPLLSTEHLNSQLVELAFVATYLDRLKLPRLFIYVRAPR
jgi:hypothetical protein